MIILSIVFYIIGIFCIFGAISGAVAQLKSALKKGLPQIFYSGLFVGLIFIGLGLWTWPSKDTSKTTITQQDKANDSTSKPPLEQVLASLDAGHLVPDTSLKVIRIKTLLNRLSNIYNEPIDSIAEWTSKAQGAIHDEGKQESCANILENMYSLGKVKDVKYKDAVTLYGYLKSR